MSNPQRQLLLVLVLAVCSATLVGCDNQLTQRREPKLLYQPLHAVYADRFTEPMILNAAAHNTALADGHFHPHTGELNSLGAKQLDRLCVSLDRFGGTVRYETRSTDEELIAARLQAIEQYLTDTGMVMTNVEVAAMMSGGRGMSATDAIAAKVKVAAKADKAGGAGRESSPNR